MRRLSWNSLEPPPNSVIGVARSKSGPLLSLNKKEAIIPLFVINGVINYRRLTLGMGNDAEEPLMRLGMMPQQIAELELSK